MTRIIYSAIASLDGYTADSTGDFEWAAPDAEVHAYVNELEREIGTYVYGRRMYEVMRVWQNLPETADESPEVAEFADIWRGADKIVVSATLDEVTTPRTTLVRSFDPAALRAQASAADRPFGIGGPTLAADAFRAGIIDEVQLFLVPFTVGGGTHALPQGIAVPLELLEERRFTGGTVYLRYRVTSTTE